jgi:hypothetical protein
VRTYANRTGEAPQTVLRKLVPGTRVRVKIFDVDWPQQKIKLQLTRIEPAARAAGV